MEDKKNPSVVELKTEKKNGKEKKEWTVKRILTTVIIGILALLMVGGSFYYIFTPGFRKSANAFGFYDGEPVVYENNNVFARTLLSDDSYLQAATTGDYNALFQSWYRAYQSQVVSIALSKLAKQAGIVAPQELVNKAIIESGVFNNDLGEFDKAVYDQVSEADKRMLYSYMQTSFPFQKVLDDVFSALTSAKETEFIADYASDSRTFEYFVVGSSAYPDYLAKAYVLEHSDFFKMVDVSMISCASSDDAIACYNELQSGTSWSEAVAKHSTDAYAANDGNVGATYMAGVYKAVITDPEGYKAIAQLKAGEYTAPIEGPYGWSIFKLNKDAELADLSDAAMMAQVKEAIRETEPELVQSYIDAAVAGAEEAVKTDFAAAAEEFSLGVITIGPASNDIANANSIYGIADLDATNAVLSTAVANDENLGKSLYKDAVGTVVGPIDVEGNSLFVKISAESKEDGLGQLTASMYSYYMNQFNVVDFQNSLVASKLHEDHFVEKFFELVLGQSIQ